MREWTVNLGQRTAHQRIAHFLCGISLRDGCHGEPEKNVCILPLAQEQMADATGLTVVSVNRVLRGFRASGLIDLKQKVLTVHDWRGLCMAGEFDAGNLHRNDAVVAT